MIAFLDASALIYLLEGKPELAASVRTALTELVARHDRLHVAMSRLSWLECRVHPLRTGDVGRLARLDEFFAQQDLVWIDMERSVVELATAIRARHGLRTPDALQAACCLQLGPEHCMLTGDSDFLRVQGLEVRVVG